MAKATSKKIAKPAPSSPKTKAVQFFHPGGEHMVKKPGLGYFDWNTGKHQRKFIKIAGSYCEDAKGKAKKADLVFWGEWEPQSIVSPVNSPVAGGPRWLHEPFMDPAKLRASGTAGNCQKGTTGCPGDCVTPVDLQNTDPFVFGDCFKYILCQQLKKSKSCPKGKPCQLASLPVGSLILFGSRANSEFVIDTVFVVAAATPAAEARKLIDPVYAKATYERCNDFTGLCFYQGATPANSVNDMFSFFPCRNDGKPFERPTLPNIQGIASPKMQQGFAIIENDVATVWKAIVAQMKKGNLLLGTHAALPPIKPIPSKMPRIGPGY